MNLIMMIKHASLAITMLGTEHQVDETELQEQVIEVKQEVVQEQKSFNMEATFYGPDCKGCIGITKTGIDVRNTIYHNGLRIIAVDPSIIKLYSIVLVELEDGQSFKAIAGDTGGDIKNNRIDILVSSEKESFKYGRQKAKVTILGDDK